MKRAGDVLSLLFDKNTMDKAKKNNAVFACWEDLMEKNGISSAADHSWIKEVEKGLVWVEVDHPGWKQILQIKESKLLHDFRYRFPNMNISGISIILSNPVSPSPEPEQSAKAAPVFEYSEFILEDSEKIAAYETIKDNALKNVLKRLEKRIALKESAQAGHNG